MNDYSLTKIVQPLHKLSRASLVFQCTVDSVDRAFSLEKSKRKFFSISLEERNLLQKNPFQQDLLQLHHIQVQDLVLEEIIKLILGLLVEYFHLPFAYTFAQCRAVFSNNFLSFLY